MLLLFVLGVATFFLVVHRIAAATSSALPEHRRSWSAWLLNRPAIPDTVPAEWVDAYHADPE